MTSVRSAAERRELLKEVWERARVCVACPLHETRTTVVFGAGNADAELMFVGEAPGANEDRMGLPFVGQAGRLLDTLLGEIGLGRSDVFIANVLKCRPPGNRDPQPREIESCQGYLREQVALIEPSVICTLGNFATKLLRGEPTGISKLRGRDEVRTIGARTVTLYPLYHPAAALYTPATLEMLRTDFGRLPALLARGAPEQPVDRDGMLEFEEALAAATADGPLEAAAEPEAGDAAPAGERHEPAGGEPSSEPPEQLGLF
jgi:DNA polymerase